jgi:hypothetical protein
MNTLQLSYKFATLRGNNMINLLYGISIMTALVMSTATFVSPALAAPAIHIEKDGCGMGDGDGNAAFFPDR